MLGCVELQELGAKGLAHPGIDSPNTKKESQPLNVSSALLLETRESKSANILISSQRQIPCSSLAIRI